VSSAIHLRFDVMASSLPDHIKQRLLRNGGCPPEQGGRHHHQGAAAPHAGAESG
jgi:hypothetical protein